jgi:hypothetical protein
MKVKMLVAIAVSSLLAISLAQAAPFQKSPVQLVADDTMGGNSDNMPGGASATNPGAMNDSSTMPNSGSSVPSGSSDNGNAAGNNSTTDEGSGGADVPAGSDDSDY